MNNLTNFIIVNSFILIPLYTILVFIFLFVVGKRIVKLKKYLDEALIYAQNSNRERNLELTEIEKTENIIERKQQIILNNINIINNILNSYKGMEFNTMVNSKISKEIISSLESPDPKSNPKPDTKSESLFDTVDLAEIINEAKSIKKESNPKQDTNPKQDNPPFIETNKNKIGTNVSRIVKFNNRKKDSKQNINPRKDVIEDFSITLEEEENGNITFGELFRKIKP